MPQIKLLISHMPLKSFLLSEETIHVKNFGIILTLLSYATLVIKPCFAPSSKYILNVTTPEHFYYPLIQAIIMLLPTEIITEITEKPAFPASAFASQSVSTAATEYLKRGSYIMSPSSKVSKGFLT